MFDRLSEEEFPNAFSGMELYYQGNLDLLNRPSVGFSGSRNANRRSLDTAYSLASTFVNEGVVIVSGGARGIDETVHKAALQQGGNTIIILPYGLTKFFIRDSWRLSWNLDHVLILSQFQPEDHFTASRAIRRNRTIIELSDLIIIPESGTTGGTYATGNECLRMNASVNVCRWSTDTPARNLKLITNGATPLDV